jgi:two-component system, OmpR family, phosphate regulon response regulator OmpR
MGMPRMGQKHILVVDDDPAILELLERALASDRVRVSTARRAAMARDVLMRQPVDLVIADARLPGESGLQLALSARDVGIASILMSGDLEWTAEHGLAAGQFLAKPFELRQLLRLVAERLAADDIATPRDPAG